MFNWYDLYIAREKAERLYNARSKAFEIQMQKNEEECNCSRNKQTVNNNVHEPSNINKTKTREHHTHAIDVLRETLASGELYDYSHMVRNILRK